MAGECRLYLTTIPEALVASMLDAREFGSYLAVGTRKRSRGEAMYFSIKPEFESDWFDLRRARERCTLHPDNTPKHSVYLGIYRVLEHVPLDMLDKLYLVTRDGRVLELPQTEPPEHYSGNVHLYDEICPVHPLIVSTLSPPDFARFITDPQNPVHVPVICFTEIAFDETAAPVNLPYGEHLQDCIRQLQNSDKPCKTVDRNHVPGGWGRRFKNGFFVGNSDKLLYFPFPSRQELETKYRDWWRSSQI